MGDFDGKAVFVTGAGQGIGYGLCEAFARAGATVALTDLDADLAQQAAARLNDALGAERVYPHGLDVADVAALQHAMARFVARTGRLDVAIANAGISDFSSFLETTPDEFDRILRVNLRGSYFTAQIAAKHMIETVTSGRILLMSSVVGLRAFPGFAAYGMTKAGIAHLAQMLGSDLGGYGITVNAISPGATLTERTAQELPDYAGSWGALYPTGRVTDVTDIAQTALFLASSAARQINGKNLVVDGGWLGRGVIPDDYD